MIRHILVVCEGNICRSPMAVAFLQSALPHAAVTSAGLNALVGTPPPDFARDIMRKRGISIDGHTGVQITEAACRNAELILVMDRLQRRELEMRFPFAKGKTYRVGEHGDFDIEDPYLQGQSVFEHCAQTIEMAVEDWGKRLSQMAHASNRRSVQNEKSR